MELFLMVACMSLFGLAVTCLAFGAATRTDEPSPVVEEHAVEEPATVRLLPPGRFFADAVVTPIPSQAHVPVEALLLQIECHIRLEQAAAESFVEAPTPALLHGRTVSPFVN